MNSPIQSTDAQLQRLLQSVEVPAPRPDFVDAAIRTAIAGRRVRVAWRPATGWLSALAASVALFAVMLGALVVTRSNAIPPVESALPGVTAVQVAMVPQQAKTVRVVIDSANERDSATITISLAENLELEGFPNERVIEWDAPLKEGRNLLELPLRLMGGASSHLDVGFSHGQTRRNVRIDVSAVDPLPTA